MKSSPPQQDAVSEAWSQVCVDSLLHFLLHGCFLKTKKYSKFQVIFLVLLTQHIFLIKLSL